MISVYEERALVKGIEQGKREGQLLLLRKLLQAKFGLLSETVEARLFRLSSEELEALSERLLTASTLQELGLSERAPSEEREIEN